MSRRAEQWNQEADLFLKNPPLKSKFAGVNGSSPSSSDTSSALVAHRRKSSDQVAEDAEFYGSRPRKDRVLRAVFAAFVDLFCDNAPANQRERIRSELCSTLVHLHLVPSVFFTEEFAAIRRSFSNLISHALSQTIIPPPGMDASCITISSSFPGISSRYKTDFEELEVIGVGGFGTVYKVKCRVDNCLYAVKKIKLKRNIDGLSMKVLTEVQMLACLQHKNIVRYHSGWVEMEPANLNSPGTPPTPRIRRDSPVRIIELSDGDTDSEEDEAASVEEDRGQENIPKEKSASLSSKKEKVGAGENKMDDQNSSEVSFMSSVDTEEKPDVGGKFWGPGGDSTEEDSQEEEMEPDPLKSASDPFASPSVSVQTELPNPKAKTIEVSLRPVRPNTLGFSNSFRPIVYIQMELCSMTLEQHLARRNKEKVFLGSNFVDGDFNRELTFQVLSAIEYIHSNDLIHRDIKPANIFLKLQGQKLRFLLGDFGLACTNFAVDPDHLVKDGVIRKQGSIKVCHSVAVGTPAYAAPEQLRSPDYGPMVDIYSAGVVFFEAYNVFTTSMERANAIKRLRENGDVGDEIREHWPSVVDTLVAMTNADPNKRPSAAQLLQNFRGDESKTVVSLKEIIKTQAHELSALRKELFELKLKKRSPAKK